MTASTREEILDTAKELFTCYGYHHVSMRSISSALGISVGNLTYHFPRKADLADALLEQELKRVLMPAQPGLAALDDFLRRILSSLLENARLFSDLMMFLSIPELANGHRDRHLRLRANLLAFLQAQADAGLLCPPSSQDSLEQLTDLLLYNHLGWQHHLMLFHQPPQQALAYAIDLQWSVLRPWLTPTGLHQMQQFRK